MRTRTLVLFASILLCAASPGPAVEFLFAPTFTPASITFTLEAKVTTNGLAQGIDLFDWAAGSWVQIDVRPATLVDQVVSVPVADPGRFVHPGARTMRAQVRFKANGLVLTSQWAARIDRLAWTLR